MKRLVIILALTLTMTPELFAGVGKGSAQQLKVDVGARPVALGGNQFGSEGSLFAIYYNPALTAYALRQEVGFMHNEHLVDLRQEVVGYLRPTQNRGVFALGANYFTYGKIEGYSATGVKQADLNAYDMVLQGSWGKTWNYSIGKREFENFSTGVGFKAIQKKLADKSTFAFALDLGFVYPLKFDWKLLKGIKVAGAVTNLSNGIKFDSTTDSLPMVVRLGLGQSLFGDALHIGADGVLPDGGNAYPSLGIEYKVLKKFALRGGYKGDKKLTKNLTVGVGFESAVFSLDYAFFPAGELEDVHRASVNYRFGKSFAKPKVENQLMEKVKQAKTLYAQGSLLEAYMISMQVHHAAPWFDANESLMRKIQKGFRELEESDRREKMVAQIKDLFNRGEKFFKEGNLVDARLDFQAVLGLQPDHANAQNYLKQIEAQFQGFVDNFYKEGLDSYAAANYEKAKEQFEKALVVKPDHVEAREQLSKCIEILETRKKEELLSAKKEASQKVFNDAVTTYKKGQYEDAILLFEQVLDMDPDKNEANRYIASSKENLYKRYFSRGQDFASKGDWDGAIKNLRTSLSYNPRSREAKESLSDIQRKWDLQKKVLSQNLYKEGLEAFLGGDKKKAKVSWEKSIELDPDNEEAKRGLARITQ